MYSCSFPVVQVTGPGLGLLSMPDVDHVSMGRGKWVLLFSKPFLYSTLKAPKHCITGSLPWRGDVKTNAAEKPRLP